MNTYRDYEIDQATYYRVELNKYKEQVLNDIVTAMLDNIWEYDNG
jgi:hypothetical protein